jgi:hypothetical protein
MCIDETRGKDFAYPVLQIATFEQAEYTILDAGQQPSMATRKVS